MPNTSGQAELLFKIALGAADTGPNRAGGTKQFYEEALPSRPVVFSSSVWSEVEDIPVPAPTLSHQGIQGAVQYFEDVAFLPLEGQPHPVTGFPLPDASNAFFLNDLIDAVPFNFEPGGSYSYSLKKANGDPIYPGDGDWVIDVASGVLNFYGSLPSGVTLANPPTISFYKYIGAKGGGGGASIVISDVEPATASAGAMWWNSSTGDLLIYYDDGDTSQWVSAIGGVGGLWTLNTATQEIDTIYAVSASAKNFKISHPIPSMSDGYYLRHTSVEGPAADLMYRGKVKLIDGKATVNIDQSSNMTEGTFVALSHKSQCFINNSVDWTPIRGKVDGNILTIEAKESDCNVEVDWMVLSERRDPAVLSSSVYNENGVYQPEILKEDIKSDDKPKLDPIILRTSL